jgi:hypothetical protein
MNPNEEAQKIWNEYEALIDFTPGNAIEAERILKIRQKLLAKYFMLKGRPELAAALEAGK